MGVVQFHNKLCTDVWRYVHTELCMPIGGVRAVTLVEGRDILGSFNIKLREYAARHLTRNGVKLVRVRTQQTFFPVSPLSPAFEHHLRVMKHSAAALKPTCAGLHTPMCVT